LDNYGWSYYWAGAGPWAGAPYPGALFTRGEKQAAVQGSPESREDVLRSTKEVMGYTIQALDGEVGRAGEFIVDDKSWAIRYMVADTRSWLPGRRVLVAPSWVDAIEWAERRIFVGVKREDVKNSPPYDPASPINREYEARLYDYYGRPVYWA
jgi:hypothetical protein